jgi:hypothetical protein
MLCSKMNERVIYGIALVDHLWKPSTLFLNISGASGQANMSTTQHYIDIRLSVSRDALELF